MGFRITKEKETSDERMTLDSKNGSDIRDSRLFLCVRRNHQAIKSIVTGTTSWQCERVFSLPSSAAFVAFTCFFGFYHQHCTLPSFPRPLPSSLLPLTIFLSPCHSLFSLSPTSTPIPLHNRAKGNMYSAAGTRRQEQKPLLCHPSGLFLD